MKPVAVFRFSATEHPGRFGAWLTQQGIPWQLVPVDGRIYGEWSVGPQEPAGPRRLEVVVEGQVAASFAFEVK